MVPVKVTLRPQMGCECPAVSPVRNPPVACDSSTFADRLLVITAARWAAARALREERRHSDARPRERFGNSTKKTAEFSIANVEKLRNSPFQTRMDVADSKTSVRADLDSTSE